VRYSRRDVIDAIRYVARNGCVWRTLSRIHDTLREQVRVAEGRQPIPTAGLIDATAR
jgi:hypothetical protein